MREPARRVSSEAAAGPRPQSSARPTTGRPRSRWNELPPPPMDCMVPRTRAANREVSDCVACTSMLGPLTLPPKLLVRALEDLNALAELARSGALQESLEKLREMNDRLERSVRASERMAEGIESIDEGVERLNQGVERVAETTAPLEPKLAEVYASVEPLSGEMRELRGELRRLFAELEGAAQVIEPLQSVAERMGRIADRLPGGGS